MYFNFNFADIEIHNELNKYLDDYKYCQFEGYPSRRKDFGINYYKYYLNQLSANHEWKFHYEKIENVPFLIGCRFSKWDSDHFGFNIAFISILVGGPLNNQQKLLSNSINNCIVELEKFKVRFVSARIHGDFIEAIHAFEDNGFRYYENIIWPVTKLLDRQFNNYVNIRLMRSNEINDIIDLGVNNIYDRGHYHCDKNFNRALVDKLYGKLILSSLEKKDNIVVIEDDNKIEGFFIFRFDDVLSEYSGFRYARMYSLTLNKDARGKGLGTKIFEGMMSIAQNMGAEYIDSGYSSKNHLSAKLHTKFNFYSVYEEVTFHKWLQ